MQINEKPMRVLIITDSLGCPRVETDVTETWVDQILRNKKGSNFYFYTYCVHGLYFQLVPLNYVIELNPDLIIIQMGVVDACRRTISRNINRVISRIPVIRGLAHYIQHKFHYEITKRANIHSTFPEAVKKICEEILTQVKSKIWFICIAPASGIMKKKVYNFEDDVRTYNGIFQELAAKYVDRVQYINPYIGECPENLFLQDGHHLERRGIKCVYDAVMAYLDTLEQK